MIRILLISRMPNYNNLFVVLGIVTVADVSIIGQTYVVCFEKSRVPQPHVMEEEGADVVAEIVVDPVEVDRVDKEIMIVIVRPIPVT